MNANKPNRSYVAQALRERFESDAMLGTSALPIRLPEPSSIPVITRQEIDGLMADLLYTTSPPTGSTRLSDWAREHADTLGVRYAGELARRIDRETGYGEC